MKPNKKYLRLWRQAQKKSPPGTSVWEVKAYIDGREIPEPIKPYHVTGVDPEAGWVEVCRPTRDRQGTIDGASYHRYYGPARIEFIPVPGRQCAEYECPF